MRYFIFLILSLFVLFGCSPKVVTETVYVDRPIEVKVPVVVYPEIKTITCKRLPILDVNENTPDEQVMAAYINTIKIQKDCINLHR